MEVSFNCHRVPIMMKLVIATRKAAKIRIVVKDSKKPDTIYTDRWATVIGKETFYVRMPMSPDIAIVEITNINNGNTNSKVADNSFELISATPEHLETMITAFDFTNKDVAHFVNFAQEFCQRAGYISANSSDEGGFAIYLSDNAKFKIKYSEVIKDANGAEINTPARISKSTKIIEVSKKKFKDLTIPARMIILLHEFSHMYANETAEDEIEADYHAINIYLGLGYPRIECLRAFSKTFHGADTSGNRQRYALIEKYVTEFDKKMRVLRNK